MRKIPLKMKMFMFLMMLLFMGIYSLFFGAKNVAIGMTVVMAALMGIGNDLSFKPKLSFVKVIVLLFSLAIVAFLNNPITVWGCILTFIVVFSTTFSSYHLFGSSIYMPYLMCYFMMMCIPVTLEELPLRLLSLAFGAVFIVGLNLLVNRKKDYKLSEATVKKLIAELRVAADLKLEGKEVFKENFHVVNGLYLSIFSKFEYKYFPARSHESVLNIIKAFQYIGWILSEYDLSDDELTFLKELLSDIESNDLSDICRRTDFKSRPMNVIILNLEIIANELKNRNLNDERTATDKAVVLHSIRPVIGRMFSFHSVKFTFAFKMAFVMLLWEVLTLIFNLPYTKWLYFASIPLMIPYVNDVAYTAKSRFTGTLVGILLFAVIAVAIPHLHWSLNISVILIFLVCMFGMLYKLEDKLQMTVFTTVMSVMVSLMYISFPEAIVLKMLWVAVAVAVVSVINFVFLPYSVEKETENNFKTLKVLNSKSIGLIGKKCHDGSDLNKTAVLVLSNIIRENIEVTEDNIELYRIQAQITDLCNFILNYMDVHEFSDEVKSVIVRIISEGKKSDIQGTVHEEIIFDSAEYVMKLYNRENELMM